MVASSSGSRYVKSRKDQRAVKREFSILKIILQLDSAAYLHGQMSTGFHIYTIKCKGHETIKTRSQKTLISKKESLIGT